MSEKTESIRVRISEADKQIIERAARSLGISVSDFIRMTALKAARGMK